MVTKLFKLIAIMKNILKYSFIVANFMKIICLKIFKKSLIHLVKLCTI